MGKKARSSQGIQKAQGRKIDKSTLPPPPPPPSEELGSAKVLDNPSLPGNGFKILNGHGYDDGGVADLSLLIDLEDSVQRRRRGENEFFTALKSDLLPRATKGPMARMSRREQKVSLAQLLFSEDEEAEDKGPSEVYFDTSELDDDKETIQHRQARLAQAKAALRLSLVLREGACAALSLAELCKRLLALKGKAGGEDALRCANKALEIASDGFWDTDDVAIEADEEPVVDAKFEKNATSPGLAHASTLKLLPIRVAHLCKRSAMLQRGNALLALGRLEEARASYQEVFPLIKEEPRCARIDWERFSLFINIGNTYKEQGDFAAADEQYKLAESLGKDHLEQEGGSKNDGHGMVDGAKRARAFALKKVGREDEGKAILKEVIESQIKLKMEKELEKKKEEEEAKAKALEALEPKPEES